MDTDDNKPGLDRLALLAGRSWRATDLPGGLTNRNLRVTTTDDGPSLDVVARCFTGDTGLLGIDRDAEHENTRRAAAAGVGAQVLEYRPELGILVIEYLAGQPLDNADLTDAEVMRRAAIACRRLHAGPPFVSEFDMFARQAAYRETVRDNGFALPASYDEHADRWQEARRALASGQGRPAPCNNDLLAANFIDDGARVWLIDYEYSGNNDPFFELGNTTTECDFSEDQIDAWVEAYLGVAPSRADLARVRLQALCSEYGWSLWGFIQAATSPIDYDFTSWGQTRLEKADATFRGPRFRQLLQDVVA